jgi:hypothetical protein
VFWDVHENTIIISLEHEHYKKLIVEVADANDAVGRLRAELRR